VDPGAGAGRRRGTRRLFDPRPDRARIAWALAVCAVLALGAASAAAAPVTIYMHYSTFSGTANADASIVIDDGSLAPSTFTIDLADLTSLSLTVTGLPGSPSSTTFTKADLDGWIYGTDASGAFSDINFFMNSGHVNADGYSINGVEALTLAIFDHTGLALAVFGAHPSTDPSISVPTLSTAGLVALSLLIALAAVSTLVRRLG
jgi:IPTL-CTERM motif